MQRPLLYTQTNHRKQFHGIADATTAVDGGGGVVEAAAELLASGEVGEGEEKGGRREGEVVFLRHQALICCLANCKSRCRVKSA